jgi:hypothetical protein
MLVLSWSKSRCLLRPCTRKKKKEGGEEDGEDGEGGEEEETGVGVNTVGRRSRLTVSNPVLKAPNDPSLT